MVPMILGVPAFLAARPKFLGAVAAAHAVQDRLRIREASRALQQAALERITRNINDITVSAQLIERIATRDDKLARNDLSGAYLAASLTCWIN